MTKRKKQKRDSVSIVIPNYNGKELLLKNLPKVISVKNNKKNKIKEIIVVDDFSTDDSVKLLKDRFDEEVKVVKHRKNRGFSAAVNTGVRSSTGSYIVLLNSDVHPVGKEFTSNALPLFKKNEMLFAISFHEKGYGWAKGGFKGGFIWHEPGTEDDSPHETFFVNAGGAIYRRDLWFELGGLDEELFSPFYWEDVDISYRALKRGYKLLWHPDIYVSPNISASVNKLDQKTVSKIQERNRLIFIWKNITSSRLIRKHIRGLFRRILRHPGYLKILFMALKKLPDILKARKKLKKESKVADEAIFAQF